ncbi:hypothetical protein [Nostoc sp.]|uniref:hypothetical protein n=1 Tax=Nostoc sp. TaxID=1180 RepID=UPI002FF66926
MEIISPDGKDVLAKLQLNSIEDSQWLPDQPSILCISIIYLPRKIKNLYKILAKKAAYYINNYLIFS